MLSKLFTTARTLLDRSSQTSDSELRRAEGAPGPVSEMVTTRRQSGQDALRNDDTDGTPKAGAGSSRKRQAPSSDSEDSGSGEIHEAGTPSSKKQKVLPVRAKDGKWGKTKTRVVVEIPVMRATPGHGLSDSGRRGHGKENPISGHIASAEGSDSPQLRLEVPDSESDDDISQIVGNAEEEGGSNAGPPQTGVARSVPSTTKAKHKRFDSEEPDDVIFSTAVEQNEPEDESSDDDAPEVVGAQEALEQTKRKDLKATKAIEQRQSAVRKKRKERDAILKQQASNKPKPENNTSVQPQSSRKHSGKDSDDEDEVAARSSTLNLGPGNLLPEFLPEEFLEDSESEDESEVEAVKHTKKAKKTKFTELIDQRPKDIRKGSTTYRVAEAHSTKLAPKSSFNARSVKESWQRGRAGASRKAVSTGFFKKR